MAEEQGASQESKRARLDPIVETFSRYESLLTAKYDKHERIVKLSRDITVISKRSIFLLHRCESTADLPKSIKAVRDKLGEAHRLFARIAAELEGEWNAERYARAFSPGAQEYVEAATFVAYVETGTLASRDDLNRELCFDQGSFVISPSDYLLGVADLTGELMRLGITTAGNPKFDGDLSQRICVFTRQIAAGLAPLPESCKGLQSKLKVLSASLKKIENACYKVVVRGSELPPERLVDAIMAD